MFRNLRAAASGSRAVSAYLASGRMYHTAARAISVAVGEAADRNEGSALEHFDAFGCAREVAAHHRVEIRPDLDMLGDDVAVPEKALDA